MIRVILNNGLRFLILIAMQVFLFKNIGYYNLATPYPYVLFLLLLPVGIPNIALYIIAFTTGIVVDAFYDSLGINAAACVVLAWMRIIFFRITLEAENHEGYATPVLGEVSLKWFIPYILLTVFFHHLTLYILTAFSFHLFHYTLFSTVLSCIFTVLIIILFSLILYRRKQR